VVTAKGYVRYNGKYGSTFSNGTWGTFLNSMGAKAPRKPKGTLAWPYCLQRRV